MSFDKFYLESLPREEPLLVCFFLYWEWLLKIFLLYLKFFKYQYFE